MRGTRPGLVLAGTGASAAGSTVRVALVQPGDIDDSTARQAAGEALTATLAGQRLDLVVWGESSVGVDLHPPAGGHGAAGGSVPAGRRGPARQSSTPGLRTGGIYKSSVLIGPNGSRGSYQKTRLVPFGEYVPLRPLLGWATRHTKAAAEDRRRGSGQVVLHAGRLGIGPLISFEATFSDLPRREVQRGAQLLVYQSSTSTYQGTWAQPQLASQAAVHAVGGGPPGGARRFVRRQCGVRRTGPTTCLVPRRRIAA